MGTSRIKSEGCYFDRTGSKHQTNKDIPFETSQSNLSLWRGLEVLIGTHQTILMTSVDLVMKSSWALELDRDLFLYEDSTIQGEDYSEDEMDYHQVRSLFRKAYNFPNPPLEIGVKFCSHEYCLERTNRDSTHISWNFCGQDPLGRLCKLWMPRLPTFNLLFEYRGVLLLCLFPFNSQTFF